MKFIIYYKLTAKRIYRRISVYLKNSSVFIYLHMYVNRLRNNIQRINENKIEINLFTLFTDQFYLYRENRCYKNLKLYKHFIITPYFIANESQLSLRRKWSSINSSQQSPHFERISNSMRLFHSIAIMIFANVTSRSDC